MKTQRMVSLAALASLTIPATVVVTAQEAWREAYEEEIGKADALLEKKELEAAARGYRLANELAGGSSADALLGLATTCYHSRDYEDSVAAARRILESSDQSLMQTAAYNLLGLSSLELAKKDSSRFADAEHAFRKVLELSGGRAVAAHYSLASTLRQAGRPVEALAAAREFLRSAPEGATSDQARVIVCNARRDLESQRTSDPARAEDPRQAGRREGDDWPPGRALVIEGDVVKPRKISAPQPYFPESARRAGAQDLVLLQAIIDREGCVVDTRVLKKSLQGGLSYSAKRAVERWVLSPARLHGEPVDVYYNVSVNFRLSR